MRISIKLNENDYAIDVDGNSYTAIKFGVNKKTEAPSEVALGYFNKLPNAALRPCREEISSSPDTVSLNEFSKRVEAINQQLLNQLEAVGV